MMLQVEKATFCRTKTSIFIHFVGLRPWKLTWLAGKSTIFNRRYIDSFMVDTPPETNSSPLKIDPWNSGDSYWKPPFSGELLVSGRVSTICFGDYMPWFHLQEGGIFRLASSSWKHGNFRKNVPWKRRFPFGKTSFSWSEYTDVSKNRGTPKSSILIGFSIINHSFWGTPIFGNTHTYPRYEKSRLLGVPDGWGWVALII